MSDKNQWEHHIEELGSFFRSPKRDEIVEYLDQVSQDGWEVVSLIQLQNSNKIWITMKRPLSSEDARRRRRAESWLSGNSWS